MSPARVLLTPQPQIIFVLLQTHHRRNAWCVSICGQGVQGSLLSHLFHKLALLKP